MSSSMGSVVIFAKTPHHRTPYDQWLAGSGIEPLILTTRDYEEGYRRHLPHAHVYGFDDYDVNQLVEKTALRLARAHGARAVFARAEADVLRAAQLRDLLDLPGQRAESALAFRDKVLMKDHLAAVHAPGPVGLPAYRLLDSAYTAVEFAEAHGYPVVIKPVSESGSLGARIIHSERELDRYLASPWRGASEIESFVPGQMYHVDGLVLHGQLVLAHPYRYLNDCLSFRSNDWVANIPLSPQDPRYRPLVDAAAAVLGTLPTPANTAFHCELWITPEDRVVFCEIASRTGGGVMGSVVRHSFGVDPDKEWLYAECGLPPSVTDHRYTPVGGLCIPPSNGTLISLPEGGEPECVREASLTGRVGEVFQGGVKSGLYLAGYVVDGATEDDVEANVEKVAAWFAGATGWRR
ncbi:ATP-grasp domain-containing protein [Streptomyces boninensis]|uniref:ATP-grasp domain-containing protein n=1 Tax=Streptomyces boninensis TaxID=2039455 RepID=UPI003B213E82